MSDLFSAQQQQGTRSDVADYFANLLRGSFNGQVNLPGIINRFAQPGYAGPLGATVTPNQGNILDQSQSVLSKYFGGGYNFGQNYNPWQGYSPNFQQGGYGSPGFFADPRYFMGAQGSSITYGAPQQQPQGATTPTPFLPQLPGIPGIPRPTSTASMSAATMTDGGTPWTGPIVPVDWNTIGQTGRAELSGQDLISAMGGKYDPLSGYFWDMGGNPIAPAGVDENGNPMLPAGVDLSKATNTGYTFQPGGAGAQQIRLPSFPATGDLGDWSRIGLNPIDYYRGRVWDMNGNL